MIIEKIEIFNFGKYSGAQWELTAGLNVIAGANEYGKTTMLEFIRRMLFGFPDRRSKLNPYPAANPDGVYGGRLCGRLADGRGFILERTGSGRSGQVKLMLDGVPCDDPAGTLRNIVGVSENFYRGVYAITLTELSEASSLVSGEIGEQLYGAEEELGGSRISELRKKLTAAADALFRPGGSTQALNRIKERITELEEELSEQIEAGSGYAEAEKELEHCRDLLSKINPAAALCREAEKSRETAAAAIRRLSAATEIRLSDPEKSLLEQEKTLLRLSGFAELYKADMARAAELEKLLDEAAVRRNLLAAAANRRRRRTAFAGIACGGIAIALAFFSLPASLAALACGMIFLFLSSLAKTGAATEPETALRQEELSELKSRSAAFEQEMTLNLPGGSDLLDALWQKLSELEMAKAQAAKAESAAVRRREAEKEAETAAAAAAQAEADFIAARATLGENFKTADLQILETAAAELQRRAGSAENRLDSLRAGDRRDELRIRLEEQCSEALVLARDYLVKKTAVELLAAAVSRYEKEHQSEVVSAASRYFSAMTCDAYSGIRQRLESHEILAVRSDGTELKIAELSSGSREQLLLAMRLGLIEYCERRTEPLPAALDDVLVNFDSARREAAMKILAEFAGVRQLLFFRHS